MPVIVCMNSTGCIRVGAVFSRASGLKSGMPCLFWPPLLYNSWFSVGYLSKEEQTMKNSKPLDMAPPCNSRCRGHIQLHDFWWMCRLWGVCRKLPCPCNSRAERPVRSWSCHLYWLSISAVNTENCYFNPGCAMSLYKHDGANRMLKLLQDLFGEVKSHNVCCRHSPNFYWRY